MGQDYGARGPVGGPPAYSTPVYDDIRGRNPSGGQSQPPPPSSQQTQPQQPQEPPEDDGENLDEFDDLTIEVRSALFPLKSFFQKLNLLSGAEVTFGQL